MAQQTTNGHKRLRKMFGRIHEVAEMPNLIEVQKQSYDQFLMVEEPEGGRQDEGLQAVFRSVFPIKDFGERAQLEFVRYAFDPPKYDVEECQQRGMRVRSGLTASLLNSRWAARLSSAVSASARWRCGRSKLTARPIRCKRCSR